MKQYLIISRRKHGQNWTVALSYLDSESAMKTEMLSLQEQEPYRVYAVVPVEVPVIEQPEVVEF